MAKIYLKGASDKTLILSVRQAYYQPFFATNWTDLRVGFLLSVCGSTDPGEDDVITGLGEVIGAPGAHLHWQDRTSIGLIDSTSGTCFAGYTNVPFPLNRPLGQTSLVTSDGGIGTTNTNFWRVNNQYSETDSLKIIDNGAFRARGVGGSEMHLVQDTTGAGGYATLVALRFQRDDARGRAKVITMTVKTTFPAHSGDILYTNTPTQTVLEENLESFPDTVQQLGPVELSQELDTIWMYWPFHDSRLRVHAYGILRAAAIS